MLYFSFESEPTAGYRTNKIIQTKVKALETKTALHFARGSNVLFGFSAEKMSEKGHKAYNFGSNVGLELKYLFEKITPFICNASTVILPWNLSFMEGNERNQPTLQVVGYDKKYFDKLSYIEKGYFFCKSASKTD